MSKSIIKTALTLIIALMIIFVCSALVAQCQPAVASTHTSVQRVGDSWYTYEHMCTGGFNQTCETRLVDVSKVQNYAPAVKVVNTPRITTFASNTVNTETRYTFYNSVDVSFGHADQIYQRMFTEKKLISYLKGMGIQAFGQTYYNTNGGKQIEFICLPGVKNCKSTNYSSNLIPGATIFVYGKDQARQNIIQPNGTGYRAFPVRDVSNIITAAD